MAAPFEDIIGRLSLAPSKPKEASTATPAIPTRMYTPGGLSVPVTRQSSQASKGPIKEVQVPEKKRKGTFQEEYLSFSEKAAKRAKATSTAEEKKTTSRKEIKKEQEEKIYHRKREKEISQEQEHQQKKAEEKTRKEADQRKEKEKDRTEEKKEESSILKKRNPIKPMEEEELPSLRSKRVKHIARKSASKSRTSLSSKSQAFEPIEKVRFLLLHVYFIPFNHYCFNIIFFSGNCYIGGTC